MKCVAKCHEGLGEWDRAEEWISQTAQRYEYSRPDWFLWCQRTGHGNAKEAEQLCIQHFASLRGRMSAHDHQVEGITLLMRKKPREALAAFQSAFQTDKDPYVALHISLLMDELKTTDARAAYAKVLADSDKQDRQGRPYTHARRVLEMFRESLADGGKGNLNLRAVDNLLRQANGETRTNLEFFIGRFLELHGNAKAGGEYYRRCATEPLTIKWNHALACMYLRERGITP
jgi:tetratricopeptide (TPR) repeat protein